MLDTETYYSYIELSIWSFCTKEIEEFFFFLMNA